MSNLARRENSSIDYNGDGVPDAQIYHIVTTRKATLIDPKEDGAVGKIIGTAIATGLSRPINTLKEFWGWMSLFVCAAYLLMAWGSSKTVIPETRNFADNFRPDVVGASLGRTAKSVGNSMADSVSASEIVPSESSLKTKTKVNIQ